MMVTALYLAHLNPLTRAHVEIISELAREADSVKVMPVVFRDGDGEINSKSFPFDYGARKEMVESVFGGSVIVTDDYTFHAPFKRYLPPMLSPKSWGLRRQVLGGVGTKFFSYTGDRAEGMMLRLYGLKPRVGRRKPVSAASVKEALYAAAAGGGDGWRQGVPEEVAGIIESRWGIVERYAGVQDDTVRVAGMKFPREGWSSRRSGEKK